MIISANKRPECFSVHRIRSASQQSERAQESLIHRLHHWSTENLLSGRGTHPVCLNRVMHLTAFGHPVKTRTRTSIFAKEVHKILYTSSDVKAHCKPAIGSRIFSGANNTFPKN